MTRHYLTVDDLSAGELLALLDRADEHRRDRRTRDPLAGRTVGLLFEKPSTRTRVSFEVAVTELGGTPLVLSSRDLQLGRGETVADTARVLSRYVHALVVRTFAQERLEQLAAAGSIPIINALSDHSHPCQVLADLQTVRARLGALAGVRLTYVGDGNNVAHSLLRAGALTGMQVTVVTPPDHAPDPAVVAAATATARDAGGSITLSTDPAVGVKDAQVVYTDVWASMGQEDEHAARVERFRGYQVNADLMRLAAPDAMVLHCLPAHRGEEITDEVIDGPRSAVWDQAENRLHAQKALLELLLSGPAPASSSDVGGHTSRASSSDSGRHTS
ncbi:MAG TPA: ornithine carbamoyltransferase [Euzebyales bacterium]|nr:ornithine carbamoyltransferase [Euzebyales bacterium]